MSPKAKKWFPLWIFPVLIGMAVGTVWLRLAIIRTTYDINQTEQAIRNAHQELEQTQLKLAALRSPRRLEGIARTRFGLTQPTSAQLIHLKIKDPAK